MVGLDWLCPNDADVIDCTKEVFNNVGVHDLPVEPVREGENEGRNGDAGESIIDDPQSAQEMWV